MPYYPIRVYPLTEDGQRIEELLNRRKDIEHPDGPGVFDYDMISHQLGIPTARVRKILGPIGYGHRGITISRGDEPVQGF